MDRTRITRAAGLVFLTALLCLTVCLPAAANARYTDGRIIVVGEPEDWPGSLEYYVGQDVSEPENAPWIAAGHTGQGLRLNGTDYLKLIKQTMQVRTFTFSGWIYWEGTPDPEDPEAVYRQSLFSIYKGKSNWLTFYPHYKDAEKGIDGVYLSYQRGDNTADLFVPATEGVSCGLPMREWHHVAMVVSETDLCLYIDGTLYVSAPVVTYVGDLNASGLYVGQNSLEEDRHLQAVVDDVFVYEYDLTPEQMERLYHGIDPSDTETPLPTGPVTQYPTAVTTSQRVTVVSDDVTMPQTFFSGETGLFGIPLWGQTVILSLLLIVLLSSVILSAYEIRQRRRNRTEDR